MKITYLRIWDIGRRDEAKAVLTIEQDWVPPVGTTIFFPASSSCGKTAGTVTDVEMHYHGGNAMPTVEVWLK